MIKYDINNDLFGVNIKSVKTNLTNDTMVENDRIYTLDVNFREFNDSPVDTGIKFINGDRNTSIIKAKMLMDNNKINLEGTTITVNLKEGLTGYDIYTMICEDVDLVNSVVTINLEPYSVDLAGKNAFEFVLTKGEKVLTSQTYMYEIKESIGEGYIGESEDETLLHTLIQQTQDFIDQLTINITDSDIEDIISMIE